LRTHSERPIGTKRPLKRSFACAGSRTCTSSAYRFSYRVSSSPRSSSGVVKMLLCLWSVANYISSILPARAWPCSMPVAIAHISKSPRHLPTWCARFYVLRPLLRRANSPASMVETIAVRSTQFGGVGQPIASVRKETRMQVYYFSEFPYHEYPDEAGARYPSLRLTFPNTFYDPQTAHGLFHRYLDEYQYCEEMGFD